MSNSNKKLEKDKDGNYRYVSNIDSTYTPRKRKSRIDQDNRGLSDLLGGGL